MQTSATSAISIDVEEGYRISSGKIWPSRSARTQQQRAKFSNDVIQLIVQSTHLHDSRAEPTKCEIASDRIVWLATKRENADGFQLRAFASSDNGIAPATVFGRAASIISLKWSMSTWITAPVVCLSTRLRNNNAVQQSVRHTLTVSARCAQKVRVKCDTMQSRTLHP